MKRRGAALAALLVLVVCVLAGGRILSAREEADFPVLSPAPVRRERPVLAYLGSSAHPWDRELTQALERAAGERDWTLVTYDCRGGAETQLRQAEDLARRGEARWAVLCPADGDGSGAALLERAGVRVVVVTPQGSDADWGESCRVSPAPGEPYAAAAAALDGVGPVAVVADLPDDPRAEPACQALASAGLEVDGYGACWGEADYAGDYLAQVLERRPRLGGVLAFSLAGAQGAKAALPEGRVLCLETGEAARWALELGGVDGLVQVSGQEAARQTVAALTALAAGQTPAPEPLAVEVQLGAD